MDKFPTWKHVHVTATYRYANGEPVRGSVIFTPTYLDAIVLEDDLVLPRPVIAKIDGYGELSVQLPSTDDPDLSARGWGYTVEEKFRGGRAPFVIEVPHTVDELNLVTAVPATPVVEVSSQLRQVDVGTVVASQAEVDEIKTAVEEFTESPEVGQLVFPARTFSDSPEVPMDPDYYDGPDLIPNPDFSNNAEGWTLGSTWSFDPATQTLVNTYSTLEHTWEERAFAMPLELEAGCTYEVAVTFHSRAVNCPYFFRSYYYHGSGEWDYGPHAYTVTALSPKAEGEKTYKVAIKVGDNDHPTEGSRFYVYLSGMRAVGEVARVKSVQVRKLKVRSPEIQDEYGASILSTQDISRNVRGYEPSHKDVALATGRPIVSAVETDVWDGWPYVSHNGPNVSIGTGAGGSKILGGRGHISIGWNAGYSGDGWGCIAIGDSADHYGQGGDGVARVVVGGRAGNGAIGNDIVAIGELAAGGNNSGGTFWAPQSVSIGRRAEPAPIGGSGIQSVAIGFLAKAGGDYSIAIGANASAPVGAYQAMWGSTLIQRHTFHGGAVFNESGVGGTVDFRVEGDTDQNCLVVDYSADAVGIGTNDATAKLDVNGASVRLRNPKTPASPTSMGKQGEICWDADYVYVCVATNTWKRSPLSSW